MGFGDAVRICLSRYAVFSGRAGRPEYWWFVLFEILVSIAADIVDAVIGSSSRYGMGLVALVAALALLVPGLAVAVRRLHDTSRSGWWILIGLVPLVGWIVLLVFYLQDSHPDNRYGPTPKPTPHHAA